MHKGNAGGQQVHPGTVHLNGNQRNASKTIRYYFLDIRLAKITYFSISLFTKLILLRHKKHPMTISAHYFYFLPVFPNC